MRTQWDKELKNMNVNMEKYKVISYESILTNPKLNKTKSFINLVVIVDEAHRIRSYYGKISTLI